MLNIRINIAQLDIKCEEDEIILTGVTGVMPNELNSRVWE